MKKYLLLLLPTWVCFCLSCNNPAPGGPSAAAQKNLEAQRGVANAFDTKDFSKLGDYIASDAVDHAGAKGDIKGLDSLKAAFIKESETMDNLKTETLKELADDDYAMSWYRFSGNFKKDGEGHKAGDPFTMTALEVSKFKDGKAVEHWTFMEPKELMKMMGGGQQAMPMATDSTKKK